jgi:hypothetical protein
VRSGAERLNDRCNHGYRMPLDPNADPACPACRVEMGLPVASLKPGADRARRGYCGVPGHEHLKRWPSCAACDGETAAHRAPPHRPDPDAAVRRHEELNRP